MPMARIAITAQLVLGAVLFAAIPPSPVEGATNFGLALNGSSQYVTFGPAPGLDAAQFTLEIWFMRTGPGVGTGTGAGGIASAIPLLTKGRAESDGSNVDMNYFLGIDATSGKLVADFEEGPGGTGPLGLNHPVSGTTVVTANAWHHAAATYDGTWRIYLDGALDATLVINQPPRSDSIQHAALGSALTSTGVAAGFFQGVIDEARTWNVARTQAQIQAAMGTEISSAQAGLIGHWSLDEGAGTLANNTFGTAGVNGALVGSPSWVGGFTAAPDTTPPAAPQNLAASATLNAGASLAWTPNTEPDLAGYNVYRSTSSPVPTTGSPLNGALLPSPSYSDTSIVAGTTEHYCVTAMDTSGNASLCSNEATATLAPGNYGLQLNGSSQSATVGSTTTLRASQFTLEVWFRRAPGGVTQSSGAGGATVYPLITKGRAETETAAADVNYFFGIDANGHLAADFEEAQTGASPSLNHPITGSGTVLTTDTSWHHAAATYDGTTWHLYLDGALDGTLVVGQPANTATTVTTAIGTTMNTLGVAAGAFSGTIDEVRIWNVARTQAQIQSTMGVEVTSATAGLLGAWNLDEGSGSNLGDSSGNATSGTAMGGPTWVAGFVPSTQNLPPTVALVAPATGTSGTNTSLQISVTPSDPEGQPLIVIFFGRPHASGAFGIIANASGVVSGTPTSTTWSSRATGQRYDWYVTVSDGTTIVTSPAWTFDTAPGPDPVIVGAGDIAACSSTGDEATANILAGVQGGVFTLGDNVYANGLLTEFNSCYAPSWGVPSIKSRTQPISGNHDFGDGTNNGDGYFDYFDGIGAANGVAGPRNTGIYSYNVGSYWHVVVLNSECGNAGVGCTSTSPQATWLKSDLAANASRNVIVMIHRPFVSSGGSAGDSALAPLWAIFYDNGVDLVLSGHDHNYERFSPLDRTGTAVDPTHGVREIIVGTGGINHAGPGAFQTGSLVSNFTTYGVLKLTLHATSYDWTFLPESGASFTDSGSSPVNSTVNQAPVISSVSITPSSPTTNQTLTAPVVASDPNGDPLTYTYQWSKNGSAIVGATASTLDLSVANNGDRGDVLAVRVTASDGVLSSAPVTSAAVTVVNSPPTATVSLSPAKPTTNQTVTATATTADADGDPVTLTYTWKVAGAVVKVTSATSALTDVLDLSVPNNGDRAQAVSVEVSPSDGTATGTIATSSVTVADSPPTLAAATIAEPSAKTNDVIHAVGGATADADADTVTLAYQWTKNGVDIAGATGASLDLSKAGNGDKGDAIRVRITPGDGTMSGSPVTSASLTISNSPPTTSVSLSTTAPGTNAILTATARTADPDGDPVTLTFVWSVNGTARKTTTNTTSLTDSLDLSVSGNGDPGDTVTVKVTPSDGTTAGASVSASATVVAGATAPGAPQTLAATPTRPRGVLLTWTAPAATGGSPITGYQIWRSTASGAETLLLSVGNVTSYRDTATTRGVTYYYRVEAVNTVGASVPSNEASAIAR